TLSACTAKPRSRAIASTTAESMPPETSTTAGFFALASIAILSSAARLVVPQQLVQLQLEAHGRLLRHDPVGQVARRDFAEAGREQDLAAFVQAVLGDHADRPVEVRAVADDELHLVARGEQ